VAKKRVEKYRNAFRQMAVDRLTLCDNIEGFEFMASSIQILPT
jgi:hypothetical protein